MTPGGSSGPISSPRAAIVNLTDQSFTVIPEATYSPRTNLELRLRAAALVGERKTEYGEKRNDYRVELRARYFF